MGNEKIYVSRSVVGGQGGSFLLPEIVQQFVLSLEFIWDFLSQILRGGEEEKKFRLQESRIPG